MASDWASLREPADVAARSQTLARAVAGAMAATRGVFIVDIGTGNDSNLRYLSPYLATPQLWLLVRRDPAMLANIAAPPGCEIDTRVLDLGAVDNTAIFVNRHLVTASALLDLVSERWLATLAARCRDVRAAVLFALNYDGRWRCSPAEPEDAEILALFNRHQVANDRGFGPALGPDAVHTAVRCFIDFDYQVQRETSNWTLEPDGRELQRKLVEGWAAASEEIAPEQTPMIRDWLARRLAHIDAGRSHIVVCHEDMAAWPNA